MKSSGNSTRGYSAAGRFGSAVLGAFLMIAGGSGIAAAQTCLGDAAGDPDLECTANDFGVASVTVTNVINGCESEGDTFNFDGTLNIDTTSGGNADRYDAGFYIAANGTNALTGSCFVGIIPENISPVSVDDGDACGDYEGGTTVAVPVSNVTAACVDQDNDGFFDLAICAGYDNNSNTVCNGPQDAVPGTGSKCRCATVPTNLEIPHCDVNTDCVTDNNFCTNEVCVGLNGEGANFFGCASQPNTNPCRLSAGVCDVQENCTGGSCPADGFATGECRASTGVCDPAENCSGAAACPADTFLPGSTVCRASGGVCDIAENCTGTSGACPAPGFTGSGTVCRGSAGVCDVAENCTGSTATCPGDGFASSGTCRASAGVCDVAETCTGGSANCPGDGFVSGGTTCRASAGVCDVLEACTGSTAACPADGFQPTTTICRADAGDCDVAEQCTGSANCPGNGFEPAGTVCTTDSNECTDDLCNASGTCEHTDTSSECVDDDACTEDSCNPDIGCVFDLICEDVCRSPGFWATHSGDEKAPKSINVGQLVIDAAGGLEVCGQSITATSGATDLSSDLQGLCMKTQGVKQRQLYRQLIAAALNCVMSNGNDCDDILLRYVDVNFSDCSALCETGVEAVDGPSIGDCISGLDCFNNGGQIIEGSCFKGFCEGTDDPCNDGDCGLDGEEQPIPCVEFEDNCHSNTLCKEAIDVCPKSGPASSSAACRDARQDDCTIDSCD